MQTFLPLPTAFESLECLDARRLGKQRLEVLQIVRVLRGETEGYQHHPAVKMWAGYEGALVRYGLLACGLWADEGHADSIGAVLEQYSAEGPTPPWLADERFMEAQRSNLVRKDPEHYRLFFPEARENLAYLWPVLNDEGGYRLALSEADRRRVISGERVRP